MKPVSRDLVQAFAFASLSALAWAAVAEQGVLLSGQQPGVILGVLEDHPGLRAGAPNFWRVRALFERQGGEWKALPNPCTDLPCLKALPRLYPKEVRWTIAFDGRNLGQVTARTLSEFLDPDSVGAEQITSSGPVPTVGKRSLSNAGFYYSPTYRSLVAVSKPNFKDPDVWKPSHIPEERINALRRRFRAQFPRVSNCKDPVENVEKPWRYHDEDIKLGKTYSSRQNWSIADLHLAGWNCDETQRDGSPFLAQWYTIDPAGEIGFLGAQMWLLDAGDYDGDGKSELLFMVGGFEKDAFRLFYQDFTKSVEFSFYHN
jgi:hypothetical protein